MSPVNKITTKMKKETRVQKKKELRVSKASFSRERLANARVIQKDLLYIIGLSPRISNKAVISPPT